MIATLKPPKNKHELAKAILSRIRPVKARFQAFSVSQFHGMSSSMRLIL
jgi:hypothetical protein